MINKQNSKKLFIAASIASIMAVASPLMTSTAHSADGHCYGVNKCKGTGDCGGKGHSCAGKNSCKGQGWLDIDADTCLKIEGGRLTPEA